MTNEAFARVKIDALLAAQGWNTLDTNAVRFEVQLPDGTRADYVLCDRHGRSLAVIEAKRYSVSPGDAAAQAKAYAQQLGVPCAPSGLGRFALIGQAAERGHEWGHA
jgi:type I restriction enzyme R subunit